MAQAKKHKSALRSFLKRLFCKRSVIVISEHKADHIPINVPMQLGVLLIALGVVGWVSYSTGSYMAAQSVLEEKDRTIRSTSQENQRIASDFALLKRDLMALAEEESDDKLSDYKQFVLEQYKETDGTAHDLAKNMKRVNSLNSGVVLERIEYLEEKVLAMQEDHTTLIDSIRDTTKGKIAELEDIINHTGLNAKALEQRIHKSRTPEKLATRTTASKNDPQGGPYYPVPPNLAEQDAALFSNLQRMMTLNEVVGKLPLDKPMINARTTSGFGIRIDPFRKRPARHTGIDFSGPAGSKIYSTNDGVVTKVGRRSAYGIAVEIDHGLGVSTLYGHLSRILVEKGQRIAKGQPIGIQGSTGRSTGNHLHYEVRFNDIPLNPDKFLKARNYVQAQ